MTLEEQLEEIKDQNLIYIRKKGTIVRESISRSDTPTPTSTS